MNAATGRPDDPGTQRAREADEIERDIDQTREELGRTLDALQAKLSVKRRVEAAKDSARENGAAIASAVVRTVKTYPVPLLILAVPFVWAFASRHRSRRHRDPI